MKRAVPSVVLFAQKPSLFGALFGGASRGLPLVGGGAGAPRLEDTARVFPSGRSPSALLFSEANRAAFFDAVHPPKLNARLK